MKSRLRALTSSGIFAILAALAGTVAAADVAAWTDAEMEEFLQRAEMGQAEKLPVGVTGSKKVNLSLNGHSHPAHVQTIDEVQHRARVGNRIALTFHDSYRYNIAAYRLDRLLDLHMVPVSVEREVDGKKAAVTWWVDDVLMMERDRLTRRIKPPRPPAWYQQVHKRRVLYELAANSDPNQGNILIAGDWKMWLVDFTRAFTRSRELLAPDSLVKIEGGLLQRLRALSREQVEDQLGSCLTPAEIRPLLARRDAIVRHFDRRIKQLGDLAVVYHEAETEL